MHPPADCCSEPLCFSVDTEVESLESVVICDGPAHIRRAPIHLLDPTWVEAAIHAQGDLSSQHVFVAFSAL